MTIIHGKQLVLLCLSRNSLPADALSILFMSVYVVFLQKKLTTHHYSFE